MKKFTKISLMIAAALVIAGLIFIGAGAVMAGGARTMMEAAQNEEFDFGGWSFEKGSDFMDLIDETLEMLPGGNESVTNEITGQIKKIDMQLDLADVTIRPSDTDELIVTFEDGYLKHYDMKAVGSTVFVSYDADVNNYKQGPKITVEVPGQMPLEHIYVNTSLGEIRVRDLQQALSVMELQSALGNVAIENCKVNGMGTMNVDMGNIEIEDSFFETIDLNAAMGNIEFSGTVGGDITAQADMGDVEVELKGKEANYNIELSADMGTVTYNGEKQKGQMGGSFTYHQETASADISLNSSMGNVELTFDEVND